MRVTVRVKGSQSEGQALKEITAMKLEAVGPCQVTEITEEPAGLVGIVATLQAMDSLIPEVRKMFAGDIRAGAVASLEVTPGGYGEQMRMEGGIILG